MAGPVEARRIALLFTPDVAAEARRVAVTLQSVGHVVSVVPVTLLGDDVPGLVKNADALLAIIGFDLWPGSDGPRMALQALTLRAMAVRAEKPVVALLLKGARNAPADKTHGDLVLGLRNGYSDTRSVQFFSNADEAVMAVLGYLMGIGWLTTAGFAALRPTHEGNQPSTIAAIDVLILAWRLVAAARVEPEILLHLDPKRLRESLDKLLKEIVSHQLPGPEQVAAVLSHLESSQREVEPNALWLAWMQQVHAASVDAAKATLDALVTPRLQMLLDGQVVAEEGTPVDHLARFR
jgi:hypothetical protein